MGAYVCFYLNAACFWENTRIFNSLVAQQGKDLALSVLWLGSLSWPRFCPWAQNFCMPWARPKNKAKNPMCMNHIILKKRRLNTSFEGIFKIQSKFHQWSSLKKENHWVLSWNYQSTQQKKTYFIMETHNVFLRDHSFEKNDRDIQTSRKKSISR